MRKYRHEIKYTISSAMAEVLKQRLMLIMDVDKNSFNLDNTYSIRSLYFDDLYNSAYNEKIDGVEFRKKYRIRIYNYDDSFIRLECKYKHNNMTSKDQIKITKEIYNKILNGEFNELEFGDNKLFNNFLIDLKTKNLKPSVIVDYKRLALTYPISDVRITFDSNISSGMYNYDLFNENKNNLSIIDDNKVVLEVKYNEILPESIAVILATIPSVREAFSKFAYCNIKGV
ncbi:MAG: polyphosphate polymerase domain-containing protein [Firmicutes bacterium]|nr:polyphosphate polymerase domain-containing protein [Bacillota bacterium]